MQANCDRVGADPQHRRDPALVEVVPRDQTEEILVVGSQPTECSQRGAVSGLACGERDRLGRRLASQLHEQTRPPSVASSLVGSDPPRNCQQPRQRIVRKLPDRSPGDDEGLRHNILRVGIARRAAKGIGEHAALVRLEQFVQLSCSIGRCGSLRSHSGRTRPLRVRFRTGMRDRVADRMAGILGDAVG